MFQIKFNYSVTFTAHPSSLLPQREHIMNWLYPFRPQACVSENSLWNCFVGLFTFHNGVFHTHSL